MGVAVVAVAEVKLFSSPFRVFFFLCASVAMLAPFYFVFSLSHEVAQTALSSILAWHAHEMIFAFGGALVVGFLLTAGANWTQSQAISGTKLFVLSVLFCLERILLLFALPVFFKYLSLIIFWPFFIFQVFKLLRTNQKNFRIFIAWLIAFFAAKCALVLGDHFEHHLFYTLGKHAGSFLLILLINLMSFRILPFFTSARLGFKITTPETLLKMSTVLHILLIVANEVLLPRYAVLSLFSLALITQLIVLGYWKPWRREILEEPMLVILFCGWLWIIIGYALYVLSFFLENIEFGQSSLHALTAGSIGTYAIGMLTRVSKGHTGRKISANYSDILLFVLVTLGALARVFVPIFDSSDFYNVLLYISMLWAGGFLLYLIFYSNILFSKRLDEF